jgi:hypothetical protein
MPPIIPDFKFNKFLDYIMQFERADVEFFLKQQHRPALAQWVLYNNAQALFTAIKHDKFETYLYLFEVAGIFKRKIILSEKYNILYYASKQKNIDFFEHLLAEMFSFADRQHFRENAGFEIYHEAVRENHYAVVKALFNADSEHVEDYLNINYFDNLIHALEYPSGQMFKFLLNVADNAQEILSFREYVMIEMILSKSHAPALHALNERFPKFLGTLPDAPLLRLAHQICSHHSDLMLDTFLGLLQVQDKQRLLKLLSTAQVHEICAVGRSHIIETLLISAQDLPAFKKGLKKLRTYDAEEVRLLVSRYEPIFQCMQYAESMIAQKPIEPKLLMPMLETYKGHSRARYLGFLMTVMNEANYSLTSTLVLQQMLPALLNKMVQQSVAMKTHSIHELVPVMSGMMAQEVTMLNKKHAILPNTAIDTYANFYNHLQSFDPMLDYNYPLQTTSAIFNDFVHQQMGLQASILRSNPLARCRYLFIDVKVNMNIVYDILTLICNQSIAHYESIAKYSAYSHWSVLDIGDAHDESEDYDYIFMDITPAEWIIAYAQTGKSLNLMMLNTLKYWIDCEQSQKISIDVREPARLLTI